jgi:CheY-like chemotaxis protein
MKLPENIKILLAEDDEDDQLFFRQALVDSGLGAELTVLSDGEKLIAYMQNLADATAPDVIILDLNMPGTDGKHCLREIRRNEIFSDLPIIILTTSNRQKDIEDAFRDGANRYISKLLFYNSTAKYFKLLFQYDWRNTLINTSPETFHIK